MRNKKLLKASLLLVLTGFGLTACDEINSVKTLKDYNSPVVTGFEDSIFNNELTSIYDEFHDGHLPSDTLNKVLYKYSISVFGKFNAVSEGNDVVEITLTEAAHKDPSDAEFKKFVDNHKAYQVKDDGGNTDYAASFDVVEAKYNTIEDRIAESMYSKISGSSYSFRKHFFETKLLRSLKDTMNNVADPYAIGFAPDFAHEDVLIMPDVEAKDVFENYLTRSFYGQEYGSEATKFDYIEKEILPEIYRGLLTEQYIIEKSNASIGRSFARKVNILEVSENGDYPLDVDYMMKNYFCARTTPSSLLGGSDDNLYSFVRSPDTSIAYTPTNVEEIGSVTVDDFYRASAVINGSDLTDNSVKHVLDAIAGKVNSPVKKVKDTATDITYYEGTEFSSLMKDYGDIYKDSAKYSTFSGNGSYSTEVGLQIQRDDITLSSHVKTGWFIKSDLSSYTFADKLFSLQVATAIDKYEELYNNPVPGRLYDFGDRYYEEGGKWVFGGRDRDYNKYICRINGSYFLKNTDNDKNSPETDILFQNDGKYYIVQIEEAVSSSKLTHFEDKWSAEEVKNEVLKIISSTGSYATLAKEYWLEQMSIVYHDQSVYDYFKSNYPDLFE